MERQIVISGQHNKYQLKKMLGALLGEDEYKEKKQQVDVLFYNPEFNDHIIEYLHKIVSSSGSGSDSDSIDMNMEQIEESLDKVKEESLDKVKEESLDKVKEETLDKVNVKEEAGIIKNVILTNQIKDEIIKNIHNKMNGYKNQDIKKKVFDQQLFITQDNIIQLIIKQDLKCFYCNSVCLFFYKFVREKKQWTLDRIDNSKGHYSDNVILSCLKCNLTRRNQDKNKFYQGKNFNLVKMHN